MAESILPRNRTWLNHRGQNGGMGERVTRHWKGLSETFPTVGLTLKKTKGSLSYGQKGKLPPKGPPEGLHWAANNFNNA